jgi:hypothetical protein
MLSGQQMVVVSLDHYTRMVVVEYRRGALDQAAVRGRIQGEV